MEPSTPPPPSPQPPPKPGQNPPDVVRRSSRTRPAFKRSIADDTTALRANRGFLREVFALARFLTLDARCSRQRAIKPSFASRCSCMTPSLRRRSLTAADDRRRSELRLRNLAPRSDTTSGEPTASRRRADDARKRRRPLRYGRRFGLRCRDGRGRRATSKVRPPHDRPEPPGSWRRVPARRLA